MADNDPTLGTPDPETPIQDLLATLVISLARAQPVETLVAGLYQQAAVELTDRMRTTSIHPTDPAVLCSRSSR